MDNQANPTPLSPKAGKKSLIIKLLVTLALVLAIGGLVLVLNSDEDDDNTPAPTSSEQPTDSTQEESNQETQPDQTETESDADPGSDQSSQSTEPEAVVSNEQTEAPQSESDQSQAAPQLAAGRYVEYRAPEQLDSLSSSDRWLNFHADWCPFCQALDENINSNLDQIPNGVTIVKVDFDDNQDLRVRYGVARQTVIVRIDSDGNETDRFDGYGRNATLGNISSTFGY